MSSDFGELAHNRQLLQDFCKAHVGSILTFKSGPSFKLNPLGVCRFNGFKRVVRRQCAVVGG